MWELVKDIPYRIIVLIDKLTEKNFVSRMFYLFAFIILLGVIVTIGLDYLPTYLIKNIKPEVLGTKGEATYYCAIITSLVTILGVWLTLNFNSQQMKEQNIQNQEAFAKERRLNVMPRLIIQEENKGNLEENSNEGSGFIYNDTDFITYINYPHHIKNFEKINLQANGGYGFELLLINVGLGACINLTLQLSLVSGHSDISEKFNLLPKENLNINIEIRKSQADFIFSLKYEDIYGNGYKQEYYIKQDEFSNGKLITKTKQELIWQELQG